MSKDNQRADFEAWLRSKWTGGYGCAKYDDGSYVDPIAQLLWESRQAGRTALQSQDREDASYKRGYADGQRDADNYIKGCLA
ncbi:hypothetical protein ACMHYO_14085 [Allopusillimonas ginsengisoli]|uniref:hypothetical protein n=1 Tax=Allopusillimonas ginsengisoli TaxID=453575 RepID=UPI0039C0F05B